MYTCLFGSTFLQSIPAARAIFEFLIGPFCFGIGAFTRVVFLFLLSFPQKHHPDKPGGDVDTFRTLKRAQTVLSNPKLRQQYDILGLDLDDDEVEQHTTGNQADEDSGTEPQTAAQGIMQDIASASLAAVLQLGVRTGRFATTWRSLEWSAFSSSI